jgi:sodium/hydrogen antiporter
LGRFWEPSSVWIDNRLDSCISLPKSVQGLGFSHVIKYSHKKNMLDRESYVAQYLAVALFTTGLCSVLGVDDLLGAFAAGTAISWDGHFNEQTEHEVFSSVIDLVLNCACFVYIGAWLPFHRWSMPEHGVDLWKLSLLLAGVLFFRRIPSLLLTYRLVPEIKSWKEALFSGHFGKWLLCFRLNIELTIPQRSGQY